MTTEKKTHPFAYTLGPGPYTYKGFGKIVFGQNGAQYFGPKMDVGCGTCAHCGMAILNIFIVQTSDNKLCGVGCDCINKILIDGDFTNVTEYQIELKRQKRIAGQEQRERQRLKLKDEVTKMVKENQDILANIPYETHYTKTAIEYCNWYISGNRTLGGYKMFKNKLLMFGLI